MLFELQRKKLRAVWGSKPIKSNSKGRLEVLIIMGGGGGGLNVSRATHLVMQVLLCLNAFTLEKGLWTNIKSRFSPAEGQRHDLEIAGKCFFFSINSTWNTLLD